MMHGLLAVDMQGCFNCVLPEESRQTSVLSYGFSFFKQSSIEPLCMTVLLGCMGNWSLMCNTSGQKERLKFFAQEFPPSVWLYRDEQLTGEDLSPVSHRLKMLCSSIFVMYERNKCITGMIINECKNILDTQAWFNWHRTNEIHVNQCKRLSGPFIRGQKWLIGHLPHSTSFAGRWGSRNRDSG